MAAQAPFMPLAHALLHLAAAAQLHHHRRLLVAAGPALWCVQAASAAVQSLAWDTCAVWIASPTGCPSDLKQDQLVAPEKVRGLLGSGVRCLLLNLHEIGLDPDTLGIAEGTVVGGGVLVLLVPPLAAWWQGHHRVEANRLAIWPYTAPDVAAHFLRRFIAMLRSESAVTIVESDRTTSSVPDFGLFPAQGRDAVADGDGAAERDVDANGIGDGTAAGVEGDAEGNADMGGNGDAGADADRDGMANLACVVPPRPPTTTVDPSCVAVSHHPDACTGSHGGSAVPSCLRALVASSTGLQGPTKTDALAHCDVFAGTEAVAAELVAVAAVHRQEVVLAVGCTVADSGPVSEHQRTVRMLQALPAYPQSHLLLLDPWLLLPGAEAEAGAGVGAGAESRADRGAAAGVVEGAQKALQVLDRAHGPSTGVGEGVGASQGAQSAAAQAVCSCLGSGWALETDAWGTELRPSDRHLALRHCGGATLSVRPVPLLLTPAMVRGVKRCAGELSGCGGRLHVYDPAEAVLACSSPRSAWRQCFQDLEQGDALRIWRAGDAMGHSLLVHRGMELPEVLQVLCLWRHIGDSGVAWVVLRVRGV